MNRQSFRIVLDNLPETMRKLCSENFHARKLGKLRYFRHVRLFHFRILFRTVGSDFKQKKKHVQVIISWQVRISNGILLIRNINKENKTFNNGEKSSRKKIYSTK